MCTVPGAYRWRRAPGHRRAESVVDLEGPRIPPEASHLFAHPRRQLIEADQATIEVLRGDISQHCAPGADKSIKNLYPTARSCSTVILVTSASHTTAPPWATKWPASPQIACRHHPQEPEIRQSDPA